ncbi:MAG: hypothetical protein JWM68_2750 [Verrucomicrobiales bacterium]|nr:hypothetical protein [Verrucomicrobiales bacterium]
MVIFVAAEVTRLIQCFPPTFDSGQGKHGKRIFHLHMSENTGSSKERHRKFIEQVLETGEVWGLQSVDGWCVSGDEGKESMPFWSDRAGAAACAKEEWSGFEPTSIPLEEFVENWLPGMAEDGVVVGTNWNADLGGVESKPLELKQELEKEE